MMIKKNKILNKGLIQINTMGIILSLVLFSLRLFPSYCTENLQEEKTQLSIAHTFIVPDNAQFDDDCGKFYSLFTHTTINQIQFEIIEGNEDGIFKIDRLAGNIKILDNIKLDFNLKNKHILIIKTQDGDIIDIDSAIIHVKDADKCIFIDPSYTGTERGTRGNPYNSWKNVSSFRPGYTYLQKRNTKYSEARILIPSPGGTYNNHITIGAYGKGNRPELDGKDCGDTDRGIIIGNYDNDYPAAYIDIYSFVIYNWGWSGIGIYPNSNHITISDVDISYCQTYAGIYVYHNLANSAVKLYNKIYNTVTHDNYKSHGIKVEGSGNEVINCKSYGNKAHGFHFTLWTSNDRGKYLLAYNNSESGINIDGDSCKISYSICRNNYNGVTHGIENAHENTVKFLEISQNYCNGIYCGYMVYNNKYENNTIYGNRINGISLSGEAQNITIARNMIYDNTEYGIEIYYNQNHPGKVNTVNINYNIIFNNKDGMRISNCNSVFLYNNTVFNNSIFVGSDVNNVLIKNNISKNITGSYSGSNNIISASDTYFLNPTTRNFNLKEGVEAIDGGINIGLKYDFSGNVIVGNPDIGALEFYRSEGGEVNNPPILFNKILNVADTLSAGTYVGSISAVDYDEGQQLYYSIKDGNINSTFSINSSTGDIILNDDTEFASLDSFCLTINVRDDGPGNLSDTGIVLINIISTSPGDETQTVQNHPPAIKNQVFYIGEGDELDNFTATVEANDPDIAQNLTFSITAGNDENIFTINSITGNLTISDTSKIDFEESTLYNLNVKVQDDGEGNLTSSAMIKMVTLPRIKTFYIDPTNANDPLEDGTIDHPFDSWADVSWQEGNIYLQKRGTTANENKINIYANNVVLGAYGEGESPVINSLATDFAIRAFEKTDVTIQNLKIVANEAISCIYLLGSSCDNNLVENCYLEGADNGLRIIDGKTITLRYNTFSNNSDAIYSYAETTKVYYNVFKENDTGVNVSSYLSSTEIYNNVFYDNSRAVSTSYSSLTIYNNIFYLIDQGDQAINHKLDNLVSDNNIFYPEQDGFLDIGDKKYSSLYDYQQTTSLDMNSFTSDPLFQDVYNNNFSVEPGSPAIDGGRSVGLLMDYYGYSVPSGRNPDIGLVELLDNQIISSVEPLFGDGGNDEAPLIFPNPSDGRFKITFANTNFLTSELQIKDISGNLVYRDYISADDYDPTILVDISNAPKGIYLVLVAIDDKIYTQRVVIN
jgi:hypothetical protein